MKQFLDYFAFYLLQNPDGDLDSEVIDMSVRRLKLPRNSLPALFETGSLTGNLRANLKTADKGNERKPSLKNIFLDVAGNKNSNTDAGKTLIKSSSCGLARLSLLKNKDEASEVRKSENGLLGKKCVTDVGDLSKSAEKQNDNSEKNEQNSNADDEDHDTEYIRFISDELTLLERVKRTLASLDISAVNWNLTEDNVHVGMFITADGVRCEEILEKLTYLDVGAVPGSSISVFPATISVASVVKDDQAEKLKLEMEREDKLAEKVSEFKKSIKSRLVVAQVVDSVKSDAVFTFDFLMLVILAGMVAIMGLLEASSVALVASMLISPLMGPIVAFVFGTVIRNRELLKVGVVTEMKGLTLCILVGFVSGFIPAGLESAGMSWRATDGWPTIEMASRGSIRALPIGVLIAVPSGAGVALSILGGKVGSLVGVAISASLLPPAVNAGLLWANAIVVGIIPPRTVGHAMDPMQNSSDIPYEDGISCPTYFNNDYTHIYSCNMAVESLVLGVISLLLTIVNIICIFFMGILVLKIKEVAPIRSVPEAEKDFFAKDLKIARQSYETTKGPNSSILGKKFLQEYKKFKQEIGVENSYTDNELNEILEDVEEGEDVKEILDKLPHRPKRWTSYVDNNELVAANPYHTFHGRSSKLYSPDVHLGVRQRGSAVVTFSPARTDDDDRHNSAYLTIHRYIPATDPFISPRAAHRASGRFFTKKSKGRFHVAKVEEDSKAQPLVQVDHASSPKMAPISEQEVPLLNMQAKEV